MKTEYQPKTGLPCDCKPGVQRDNCPECEGTGQRVDFAKIRSAALQARQLRRWVFRITKRAGNPRGETLQLRRLPIRRGDSSRDHWIQTDVPNAALIVRAVNEYDALRAVAKAARQWIKREDLALVELQKEYGVCKDSGPIPEMEALRQALAALDKEQGQ